MKPRRGVGPIGVAGAVVLALVSITVAAAQPLPSGAGVIVGEVANCNNSSEVPAANVAVGVDGGQTDMARTDGNGRFAMTLAPGEYTVVATADDGSSVRRFSVPVEGGQTLDIGTLDLNAGVTGCGFDADLPAVQLANESAKLTEAPLPPLTTPTPAAG